MDFTFTEEQETISKLAADVFERRATPERLTELEAGEFRYDAALWKELAGLDLLGTALPESLGGHGGGFGSRLLDAAARCRPDRPARQPRATTTLPAGRHRRKPYPFRGPARTRPLRPDQSGHHGPPRRRKVAAGRRQRVGLVRPTRRYPADSGDDRRPRDR